MVCFFIPLCLGRDKVSVSFVGHTWPISFGSGTGLGMAYANCQNDLRSFYMLHSSEKVCLVEKYTSFLNSTIITLCHCLCQSRLMWLFSVFFNRSSSCMSSRDFFCLDLIVLFESHHLHCSTLRSLSFCWTIRPSMYDVYVPDQDSLSMFNKIIITTKMMPCWFMFFSDGWFWVKPILKSHSTKLKNKHSNIMYYNKIVYTLNAALKICVFRLFPNASGSIFWERFVEEGGDSDANAVPEGGGWDGVRRLAAVALMWQMTGAKRRRKLVSSEGARKLESFVFYVLVFDTAIERLMRTWFYPINCFYFMIMM